MTAPAERSHGNRVNQKRRSEERGGDGKEEKWGEEADAV